MCSYNVFRYLRDHDVFCAVPEDRSVPRFLGGTAWEFDGKVDGSRAERTGFDASAAATAVRFNGFYVFQSLGA